MELIYKLLSWSKREMNNNKMRSKLEVYLKRTKPYVGVIFLQFGYAGQAILAKTALNQGMNHFTFAVYRNAIAALFFAPFAILFERYFFFLFLVIYMVYGL